MSVICSSVNLVIRAIMCQVNETSDNWAKFYKCNTESMDVKTDVYIFSFIYLFYLLLLLLLCVVSMVEGSNTMTLSRQTFSIKLQPYILRSGSHPDSRSDRACPSPYPCPHPQLHTSSFLWDLNSSLTQVSSSQLFVPYQQMLVYSST